MEEKKYRIKKEYNHVVNETLIEAEVAKGYFTSLKIPEEWIEEVETRVKLYIDTDTCSLKFSTGDCTSKRFTNQEKDLCEKAINGELLDVESLDSDDFEEWYKKAENCNVYYNSDYEICGIKAVLKEYLKQL